MVKGLSYFNSKNDKDKGSFFFYLNLLYILIYYKNLLIQSVTRIVSKDHMYLFRPCE